MSQTEVQLIKDAVIVNADISNSAAIDVSKISGVMPLAGGSFTDDVTFTGASANIVFDKSDNALEFNDDAKATFGTGADTTFTHSGADFAITNTTGNLNILNNSADAVQIRHGSETMIKAISDGAVELYHDNSLRLATDANGIAVTTNVHLPDSGVLELGAGSDLQIYHDGTTSRVHSVSKPLLIKTIDGYDLTLQTNSEDAVVCKGNAAVELYHNNVKKFETTSTGGKLTSSATTNGSIVFDVLSGIRGYVYADNANNIGFLDSDADWLVKGTKDAGVELHFNGSKKFETTTDGVQVGSVTIDSGFNNIGLPDNGQLRCGAGEDLRIFHDGTNSRINNTTGKLLLKDDIIEFVRQADDTVSFVVNEGGSTELYHNHNKKFETLSDGVDITGTLKVNGSAFTGGKCIKQLASFTTSSFSSTSSTFADVLSFDFTPESSSSLIVFDFTTANTSVGNSSGAGGATLGIRLLRDSTTLVNATNATDGAIGNGELDRLSGTRLVRHMEGNSNTNQRTYKVQFRRTDGNQPVVISNGTGIIVREYA